MKVVFFGAISVTDTEFPLIRELQRQGIDVVCFYPITTYEHSAGLIDIKKVKKVDKILKATEYDAFLKFSRYLDLNHIYVINNYHSRRRDWQSWLLWFKVYLMIRKEHASVFHFQWPLYWQRKILYLLRIPKVFTVHDPIPHSGQENEIEESRRKAAILNADRFVILNESQKKEFCVRYNIPESKVDVNRFGMVDWIKYIETRNKVQGRYILFWGQIQSHKGIDVLLEAMLKVHKLIPNLKCIIAGKGNFYFDISEYVKLDYLEFRNRYIRNEELADLICSCEFAVCPYRDATQSGVVQTAFSAGIPLVVTNVGSLPEIVDDGVNGLVVPPNDVESLANAIIQLSSDRELLNRFRNNIENCWMKKMSWAPIANDYIKTYNSIK